MQSLLIAATCSEFRDGLRELLRENFSVSCASGGNATLSAALDGKPDYLILDLSLPEVDGLTILQALRDHGLHPTTLALTGFTSEYVEERLDQLGVGYLMLKPCQIQTVANRFMEMSQISCSAPIAQRITQILLRLDVPVRLQGFAYIRTAVRLLLESPGQQVTKELYPRVASEFGVSDMIVERSIRNTIEAAWGQRNRRVWQTLLGIDTKDRPSNSEFLFRLAEILQARGKDCVNL